MAYDGLSMGAGSALSKRTRELQHEDALLAPHLLTPDPSPSLLATVQEHSTQPALSSTLAFARRPRAGTLPSTFHLHSPSPPAVTPRSHLGDSFLLPPLANGGAASLPGSGPTTPLDHPFPSALIPPSSSASSSHSRLRSGSLTLPSSGLSSAFGPSVFSSGDWTPRTNGQPDSTLPVKPSTSLSMDDPRSPGDSTYGEDQHVRTLDYLGLADDAPSGSGGLDGASEHGVSRSGASLSTTSLAPPSAPTMHRLGSTGTILPTPTHLGDFSQQHSRLRSNTVATFPRSSSGESLLRPYHQASASVSYPSSVVGGPSSTTPTPGEDMNSRSSAFHRPSPSADLGRLLYTTPVALPSPDEHASRVPLVGLVPPSEGASHPPNNGHDLPGRGRAATIGILDESKDVFPRRRAGTTVGIPPRHLGLGATGESGGPAASMATRMGRLSISEDHPHNPAWPGSSRPRTPEGAVSLTPPLQQPTRSLWVGNLDPKTTPAELQAVFAPYGAIESLRLIPEKECGFVNFVSVQDAMRAKEDVLNRLGGQLTKTSGLVRIGYGKAESTPAPTAPGLVHPRSTASGTILTSSADLNLQTQPTRALWIGSIPSSTTPNHLLAIFSAFGPIESARVLTHKSCGFVNFERLDDAVAARKALNNREILGAEVGVVRIGFAKVPTKVINGPFSNQVNGDGTPIAPANGGGGATNGIGSYPHVFGALSQMSGVSGISVEKQMADGQLQDYRSNMLVGVVSNGHFASAHAFANGGAMNGGGAGAGASGNGTIAPGGGGAPPALPPFLQGKVIETARGEVNEMQLLMRELSTGEDTVEEDVAAVAKHREPTSYYTSIPLAVMNDPRWARRYSHNDAPRLREIRKRLDGEPPVGEVDAIAYDLLDEVVPLASDYIGNTIVQKLFEQSSTPARKAMLERLAPHLAPIGTHKNGTWAVQKVIQCAEDEDEFAVIEQNLGPYTPPLLLNDFGNYVVQGALRFSPPHSDFIFDAMVDRIWEIGSGRFGARSTRQTLENPASPRVQVKRVASAIVLNAIPLATSSNGALLVTWLLESSNLPKRYALLAPRFAPHLSHLCTHKLASQSVLRVVNQREDLEAQKTLLDALLDLEAKTTEDILGDQQNGVAVFMKILASPFLSEDRRQQICDRVKEALESLKVTSIPSYRALLAEVGGEYSGPPAGNTPPLHGSASPRPRGPSTSPLQPYPSSFPSTPGPHNRRPPPPHQHGQQQYYGAPPPGPYPPYGAAPFAPYGPPPGSFYPPYGYSNMPPPPPSGALSPNFGPQSPASTRGPSGSSPGVSPLVTNPLPPFSPALTSPSGYPALNSPDPFSPFRTDGQPYTNFNPTFTSPLSPPPPPFFPGFATMQQQQPPPQNGGAPPPFDFSGGQ
ncbi:hypothetical protein JCM10207_004054 [Rhodosporidiobolus poonsookiae]